MLTEVKKLLTNRQLQILQVIVDDFVTSAQPVGSRQISKKESITFSPATIRNEMADLEELGFIEKTHTSSGRVPSEKGYRFYVDHILQPQNITDSEKRQIASLFQSHIMEAEQLIKQSATILSELTTYTAVLSGPDVLKHKVKRFQIVPLNAEAAVAIIVTDSGHVENKLFNLPSNINPSELEKMVNILNERITGVLLVDIPRKIESEALALLRQEIHSADQLIQSFMQATNTQPESKVYYGGKMNMLNQPEFHDLNKVRELMDLLERENQIQHLIQKTHPDIEIRIGSENKHFAMENCSVITASFQMGEEQGSIAIIGPTRMDYQRVVPILDLMRKGLSYALTNRKDAQY